MITGVGTILVPVSDQDAALAFWTGKLRFETRIDGAFGEGDRWIEVAPAGAETSIALVPGEPGSGGEVSFNTDDAAGDHEDMLAKGVDADAELTVMGDHVPPMFTFRDPDGNRFRMVERPA